MLDSRYTVLDTLGSGGMARVYLAHDEVLGRDVAIKTLWEQFAEDDDFIERFRREARNAASLQHPNIVQVYDQGRASDGAHYMAMEYVPGGTLKDRLIQGGSLQPEEATHVALKVALALEAAHGRGIIHRDVKPQNVLMGDGNPNGNPKVADFGIARAVSAATLSRTSLVMGTAGYMSPEQALGERVGPASDLYSLGVTLYEMLTGELPHDADTPVAVAIKHVNERPLPLREVDPRIPESLATVTMKLLAKDPEDRYPDAAALAGDLRRVRDGLDPAVADGGVETTETTPPRPVLLADAPTTVSTAGANSMAWTMWRRRKRRSALLAAALLLVCVAAAAALWKVEAPFGSQETPVADVEAAIDANRVEVPDVVGMDQAEASGKLSGAGFEVRVRKTESDEAGAGSVMEQSISGGERAEKGSPVGILIGEGPDKIETPDLIYASKAPSQLEEAGLKLGETTEAPSDTVAEGVITSQNPAEGTEIEPGTTVDIVVSTGPEAAPTETTPTETDQQPVQEAAPVVVQATPESQPTTQQPVATEPAPTVVQTTPESQPVVTEPAPSQTAPASTETDSQAADSQVVEPQSAEPQARPQQGVQPSAAPASGQSASPQPAGQQSAADQITDDVIDSVGVE